MKFLAGLYVLIVLVTYQALGPASFAVAAIPAVAWYWRDVRSHPMVSCRWPGCGGSGAEASRVGGGQVFRQPFGNCRCCGGKKAHPRLALLIFDSARYKKLQAEIRKARKAA